jgi:hypothetical protein
MATEPLGNGTGQTPGDSQVSSIPPATARPVEAVPDRTQAIDAVQALLELAGEQQPAQPASLAEQLLAWLAPQPRNPSTLTQSRIVPLLGVAADMLSRASDPSGEIVGLGTTALAQELRMQRALADRRATLITEVNR